MVSSKKRTEAENMYSFFECVAIAIVLLHRLLKVLLILLLLQGIVYNVTLHRVNIYKLLKKQCNKLYNSYIINIK